MSNNYLIYSENGICEDCMIWLVDKFNDSDKNDTRCSYFYYNKNIDVDLELNFIKYNLLNNNSNSFINHCYDEILYLMHKYKIEKILIEKKSHNNLTQIIEPWNDEYVKNIEDMIDDRSKTIK